MTSTSFVRPKENLRIIYPITRFSTRPNRIITWCTEQSYRRAHFLNVKVRSIIIPPAARQELKKITWPKLLYFCPICHVKKDKYTHTPTYRSTRQLRPQPNRTRQYISPSTSRRNRQYTRRYTYYSPTITHTHALPGNETRSLSAHVPRSLSIHIYVARGETRPRALASAVFAPTCAPLIPRPRVYKHTRERVR